MEKINFVKYASRRKLLKGVNYSSVTTFLKALLEMTSTASELS